MAAGFALIFVVSCQSAESEHDPIVRAGEVVSAPLPPDGTTLRPEVQRRAYAPLESATIVLADQPLVLPLGYLGESGQAPALVSIGRGGEEREVAVRWLELRRRTPTTDWRWSRSGIKYVEVSEPTDPRTALPFVAISDPNGLTGGVLTIDGVPVSLRLIELPAEVVEQVSERMAPSPPAPLPEGGGGTSQDWTDIWRQTEPTLPLEAWRRLLLDGEPIVLRPASGQRESLAQMLERQSALRWAAAMSDLDLVDPALARSLREILTRTCTDGPTRFAAWLGDVAALAEIERLLLTRYLEPIGDEAWRDRIDMWVERQPTAVFWIESDHGSEVRLAGANLTGRPINAAIRWGGGVDLSPSRRSETMLLAPYGVSRRAIPVASRSDYEVMHVQVGLRRISLPLGPATVTILPPGRTLGPFVGQWDLDAWLAARPRPPQRHAETAAVVRRCRHTQRWEVIITALRSPSRHQHQSRAAPMPETEGTQSNDDQEKSPPADPDSSFTTDTLADLADWRELIGSESITIFLGHIEHPHLIFTIRPDGSMRDWTQRGLIEPAEVRLEAGETSWTAHIRLPDEVIHEETIDLGFLRTHDRRPEADSFPRPVLPWRGDPGRLRLDLSQWQALPELPPAPPAPAPVEPPGENADDAEER